MLYKHQRPSFAPDKHCRSKFSHLRSDPRRHACHQSIPKGIPKEALPSQHTAEKATSSHPAITKEEEEKEEEVVEVSDSEDQFNNFNQPLSPEVSLGDLGFSSPAQSNHYQEAANTSDEMGIQRK